MSIRVVVDNENVHELGLPNLNNIPAMMRAVADQIEAGEHGEIECATLVTFGPSTGVQSFHWGGNDGAHDRIGLLESAKFGILTNLYGLTE